LILTFQLLETLFNDNNYILIRVKALMMIKNTLIFIICLFFNLPAFGQVGIGTTTPDAATLLHVDDGSGTKGVLIPKVQIDDLNTIAPLVTTPPIGTLVFNDAGVNPFGFHYWNGSKWVRLTGSDTDETIYGKNGTLTAERTMDMNGHNLLFANSAGRTLQLIPADPGNINAPFTFQTNNSYNFVTSSRNSLRIDDSGRVGIGTFTPDQSSSLDLADNDKGLLLNRVALVAINNQAPITNPVIGLFVYNTATNGTGTNRVQPGLYY
jgi:hypothetical protein